MHIQTDESNLPDAVPNQTIHHEFGPCYKDHYYQRERLPDAPTEEDYSNYGASSFEMATEHWSDPKPSWFRKIYVNKPINAE